jgi:hypothetical protein
VGPAAVLKGRETMEDFRLFAFLIDLLRRLLRVFGVEVDQADTPSWLERRRLRRK